MHTRKPLERLARTGGRGDERVVARGDVGPALGLRDGGPLGEAPPEPLRDGRVEPGQSGVRVAAHRGPSVSCTDGEVIDPYSTSWVRHSWLELASAAGSIPVC